ncbi:MAG: zf-HC2 domain-containing protein [Gammaproteobacteria bacterium]
MTNESDKPEVDEIDCLEAFDHLYAYLNDEITNKVDLANIEHHLSHCKSCYSRAQMERKINQRMKESGKSDTPESLQKRLRIVIDEL